MVLTRKWPEEAFLTSIIRKIETISICETSQIMLNHAS